MDRHILGAFLEIALFTLLGIVAVACLCAATVGIPMLLLKFLFGL